MDQVDEESAAKFISALIKSVQTLCHGYLHFHSGIEIIGHINVSVDRESSLHYVLEEKVCRNEENSTLFISKSFHAHQKCESKTQGKCFQNISLDEKSVQSPNSASTNEISRESSAFSAVCLAVSGSQDQFNLGSTSESERVNFLPCKAVSSISRKKELSDHNNIRTAKSFNQSSGTNSAAHYLSQSSSPAACSWSDPKGSLKDIHCEESEETTLSQSDSMNEDCVNDLNVSLSGNVFEPVGNLFNADLPNGKDGKGDLEAAGIKQEYLDGELSACQFEKSGGHRQGRNAHQSQKVVSADTISESLFPGSVHHSAPATYVPSAHYHAVAAAAQLYSPFTSHSQPATSDAKSVLGQQTAAHQLGHNSHVGIMAGENSFSPPLAHQAQSPISQHSVGLPVLDLSIKTEPKDTGFLVFSCDQREQQNSVHFNSVSDSRSEEARQKAKEKSREYRQKQKIHRMTDSTYDMLFRHQVAERKRRQRMRERIRKLKMHNVSGYSIAK